MLGSHSFGVHDEYLVHMIICDEIISLNPVERENVSNARLVEPYFQCTKVILDIGFVCYCITVQAKIIFHSSNILDDIRINNLTEIVAGGKVCVVGIQLVHLDSSVFVDH